MRAKVVKINTLSEVKFRFFFAASLLGKTKTPFRLAETAFWRNKSAFYFGETAFCFGDFKKLIYMLLVFVSCLFGLGE